MRLSRIAFVVVFVLVPCGVAQDRWSVEHVTPPSVGTNWWSICYSEADERVVAVGSRLDRQDLETWEWDGTTWHLRRPALSPPARSGAAFGYDAARSVAVLFGGFDPNDQLLDDTWEWDGVRWTQRHPAHRPPARGVAAAAFDLARSRFVIYGGSAASTRLADHWEWDGVDWVQEPLIGGGPGTWWRGSMAYDVSRARLVLAGGNDFADELWEYDGAAWVLAVGSGMPIRGAFSMAYDAAAERIVLCGGRDANSEIWEWDGALWSVRMPGVDLGRRYGPGIAYDTRRDELVVFGGSGDDDTWVWGHGPGGWSVVTSHAPRAPRVATHLGNGRTLVYGYSYSTGPESSVWNHATQEWSAVDGTIPLFPFRPAMTFDSLRQRAVLVGETAGGVSETWVWDVATEAWSQGSVGIPAPPRDLAALAYDPVRDRVVLFGGAPRGGANSAETWEWDGVDWVQRSPATTIPPARAQAVAGYDAAANRVLVYGGGDDRTIFGDVWEWDGQDWSQRVMSSVGPALRAPVFGARAPGEFFVVGGARSTGGPSNETWLIQGTAWTPLAPAPTYGVFDPVGAVDPTRLELAMFSASPSLPLGGYAMMSGVWRYGLHAARTIPFGRGCSAVARSPKLDATDAPRLGDAAFALATDSLPPSQPAAFLFGSSASTLPLPNGCRLFVPSPFVTAPRQSSPVGDVSLSLPLPLQPALAGVSVYVQSAALDLAQGDIVVANALRLQLGY